MSVKGISRHVDKTELNTRSTYIHVVAEDSVITMSPTDPSVAQFIQGTLSLEDTDDDISAEAFGDGCISGCPCENLVDVIFH